MSFLKNFKNLAVAVLGSGILAGCAYISNTLEQERKAEEDRQIKIVQEEVARMKREFDSGKLVYYIPRNTNGEKIHVNYESWKPESNYFQPPWDMENGGTGNCKGISALLADRIMKRGISNVYTVLGLVDTNYLHAWTELIFPDKEFMMWGNRGLFMEKSQISNLYFEPSLKIKPEVMKKIQEMRARPGCENLRFNFDLPSEKLKPYGIPPGEKGRQ